MAGFAPPPMQHDGVASALDAKAAELHDALRRAQEIADEVAEIAEDDSTTPRARLLLEDAIDRVQMHTLTTLHGCIVAAAATHRTDQRRIAA